MLQNNKYCKLTYGELNLVYIDKIKLKDFYLKCIDICPDESLKLFLTKALIDVEREIECIKSVELKIVNDINYISYR